ncbi:hypothetical protein TFLX_06692 [Thermoflexales bacterium]|nr:hypothetical protein TFLX_06692 [Thermoflexales bacterium]
MNSFLIIKLKPGTAIRWKMDELDTLGKALALTKKFLDGTKHPFNSSLGGQGYTFRRVKVREDGATVMGTKSGPPATTSVVDSVTGQPASVMHEIFHAYDYLNRPRWLSEHPVFTQGIGDMWAKRKRDIGTSRCGALPHACTDRLEYFADNAAAYALYWLEKQPDPDPADVANFLANFPNGVPARVGQWKDPDNSESSGLRLFFNIHFFHFETDKWLNKENP